MSSQRQQQTLGPLGPSGWSDASPEAGLVAFEIAQARLNRMAARLAEVRTNASVLLAATALVAGFLGDKSITGSSPEGWDWVALAFLIAGVLAAVRPLARVRGKRIPGKPSSWERRLGHLRFGDRLVKWAGVDLVWKAFLSADEVLVLDRESRDHVRLLAAHQLLERAKENGQLIERRSIWVGWSALCLVGQIISWTISLSSG
jgi:hypothetical protein